MECLWYGIKKPLHLPHHRVLEFCSRSFTKGQLILLLTLYIPVFIFYLFQAIICCYALKIKNPSILLSRRSVINISIFYDNQLLQGLYYWLCNSDVGLRTIKGGLWACRTVTSEEQLRALKSAKIGVISLWWD